MMYVRYRERLLRRVICPLLLAIVCLLIIAWGMVGPDVVSIHSISDDNLAKQHHFHMDFDRVIRKGISHEKDCPIPALTHAIKPSGPVQQAKCQRVKPLKGSCTVAKELFLSQPPADCKDQTHHQVCTIKNITPNEYAVHCNKAMCDEQDGIHLGLTNSSTGTLDWQFFKSVDSLETKISQIVSGKSTVKTYGFCFIKCLPKSAKLEENAVNKLTYDDVVDLEEYEPDNHFTQLLVLPANMNLNTKDSNHGNQKKLMSDGKENININIIWVDSVSRHHFFRSMPKSLTVIETINSANPSIAKVLDYKLFQAIKSRTYESFQAMIAGEVDLTSVPFSVHSMPPEPLRLENLLMPLKKSGYRTQWLEDLCWHWEWGLPKDLLSYDSDLTEEQLWERYHNALHRAGIDDVGITIASCHLLQHFQRNDPFYGPDVMCYNGLHQHDYLLHYLEMQQRLLSFNKTPYFSLMVSCAGHEPTGRRLQTLDDSLAKYLSFVSRQSNTVTFILSDHGNSYGALIEKSSEGRVELFNPFLFIIAPQQVLQKLDPYERQALFINQDRLISMIDLHQTIKYLTKVKVKGRIDFVKSAAAEKYDIPERGLLQEISANRTCSSLPLLRPNLCLCQGYEQSVQNNTYYALFADFALGQLNNEILRQFQISHPNVLSGFGNCRRLVATEFGNVRVSVNSDERAIVKLDLYIPNPDTGVMDVFLTVMEMNPMPKHRLNFISFERISKYGIYRVCADTGVDVKLCACSLSGSDKVTSALKPPPVKSLHEPIVQIGTTLSRIEQEGDERDICAFILLRENEKGVSFEAANLCSNKAYELSFHLKAKNIIESVEKWPVSATLLPGDIKHLFTGIQASQQLSWNWKYAIQYSYKNL